MWKIIKSLRFYIGVLFFMFAIAFTMPFAVKSIKEKRNTHYSVIDNQDSTYTIIHNDTTYDGLYEDEIDSIIRTFKY